ncbi:unnamed protein product [Rhizoctonia solani]|uniref:Peptide hydrolase n=1 Tax=Rhizoctonia solani TaxID=456999 RepID=A0A8H3BEH8_9AGAM|nr:unnamed protein product [Rhizoctonia solani]
MEPTLLAPTSAPPPPGSAALEKPFQVDFESKKLPWGTFASTSNSDYDAFLKTGIPTGGLLTSAAGIKSEDQAAKFGGQAGVEFDKCYHQACDTINNLTKDAFLVNARSVAHVIATTAKCTAPIDAKRVTGGVKVKARAKLGNGGFGLVDLGVSRKDYYVEPWCGLRTRRTRLLSVFILIHTTPKMGGATPYLMRLVCILKFRC